LIKIITFYNDRNIIDEDITKIPEFVYSLTNLRSMYVIINLILIHNIN